MPTSKHREFDGGDPPPRRRSYELWFLLKDGDRYYVRLTALGVLAALLLTFIPIAAILAFYFYQMATPVPRTPINIRVDSASPTPFRFDPGPMPTVRLPPVPTPQLRASDLKALPPSPAATPEGLIEQSTGRPTPRPTRPSTPPPAPSSSPPPSPTPP